MNDTDSESTRVAKHQECADCYYDLFGLEHGKSCPECGYSVEESIAICSKVADPRRFRRRLRVLATLNIMVGLAIPFSVMVCFIWRSMDVLDKVIELLMALVPCSLLLLIVSIGPRKKVFIAKDKKLIGLSVSILLLTNGGILLLWILMM